VKHPPCGGVTEVERLAELARSEQSVSEEVGTQLFVSRGPNPHGERSLLGESPSEETAFSVQEVGDLTRTGLAADRVSIDPGMALSKRAFQGFYELEDHREDLAAGCFCARRAI